MSEGFALDAETAAHELNQALNAFEAALDRLAPPGADERQVADAAVRAPTELRDAIAALTAAARRAAS
jgi:hypothetical protein